MIYHRPVLTSLLCALALGGCPGSADLGGGVVVRDSSGIHIVENPEHDPPSWQATLTMSVGVADGEEKYQFYRITDMTRFADGRIAVANGGTSEIRIYDPNGVHVQTLGGRGSGPASSSS